MDLPAARDARWMQLAVELAQRCPPSETAYAVGAVLVDATGAEIARGWSRRDNSTEHAEEAALAEVAPDDPRLATATLYSTLEPCSRRASRPRPCAELIVDTGIPRVVIAWREPPLFVADARGAEMLVAAGVEVVELPEFAEAALAPNAHLPLAPPQGPNNGWSASR